MTGGVGARRARLEVEVGSVAPSGLEGIGEMPSICSAPAVPAALRDATGTALTRTPVRPEELVAEWATR